MEKQNVQDIPPYRVAAITKTAADIAERIVSGKYLFNPTYRECEIVIDLVSDAIRKCKGDKE